MHLWKRLNSQQIKEIIYQALRENVDYAREGILGVPASYLDSKVFYQDAPFLHDAPFMNTLVHNPNHIGCHTLGNSESFFAGTQQIEKELIEICSVDILRGQPGQHDGYVTSGGTEANLQACWIYRNYFMQELGAGLNEICLLSSSDTHYSVAKASNVFCIDNRKVPIDVTTRQLHKEQVREVVENSKKEGKKYFIVFANMMTTMFGSVDDVDVYVEVLEQAKVSYKVHIDGAYGGFFYPFAEKNNQLDFSNPNVSSVTLDAHKMVQAPYGTGIFLSRKNLMRYALTPEASYVEGEDYTLSGSRSGANAIGIWMILMTYGPYGWKEKIFILLERTNWLCEQLKQAGITYYRHPQSNIVTISSRFVSEAVANKYGLVPDNHHQPEWYKVVVMEHVEIEKLIPLVEALKG